MKQIILGDNAEVLRELPESFARLLYIDPPFNTGKVQRRDRMRVTESAAGEGDRGGFGVGGDHVQGAWGVDPGGRVERVAGRGGAGVDDFGQG